MENQDARPRKKRLGAPETQFCDDPDSGQGTRATNLQSGFGSLDTPSSQGYEDDSAYSQYKKQRLGTPRIAENLETVRVIAGDARRWFPGEESKDLAAEPGLQEDEQNDF